MNIFFILILGLGIAGYVTYPLWGQTSDTPKRAPLMATAAQSDSDLDELELDRATGRLAAEHISATTPAASGPITTKDRADEIERRVRALRDKRGGSHTAASPKNRNEG